MAKKEDDITFKDVPPAGYSKQALELLHGCNIFHIRSEQQLDALVASKQIERACTVCNTSSFSGAAASALRCSGPGYSPTNRCAHRRWAHIQCLQQKKINPRPRDAPMCVDFVCDACAVIPSTAADARFMLFYYKMRGLDVKELLHAAPDGTKVVRDRELGMGCVFVPDNGPGTQAKLRNTLEAAVEVDRSLSSSSSSSKKPHVKPSKHKRKLKRQLTCHAASPMGGPRLTPSSSSSVSSSSSSVSK